MKIEEFRQQYPQYKDMSDGQLAYSLWNKSYKQSLPMGVFADQIDLPKDAFNEMIDVAKASGYTPTEQTYANDYVPPLSRALTFLRGATSGIGENISAAGAAALEKATGSEKTFGQEFNDYLNIQRDMIEQYRKARPIESTAVEVAGAIAPAIATGGATTAVRAGSSPSVMKAAGVAGAEGLTYGFATGEGGLQERAENAVEIGIPAALFGGGMQAVFNIGSPVVRAVGARMTQSSRTPTIESLRAAKTAAYQAVSDSGIVVDPDATMGLYNASRRIARLREYNPDVDKYTQASLKLLRRQADKQLTVPQLDRVRQSLWDRYKQSGYAEPAIRDMIDQIDITIQNLPGSDDLVRAARLANSRFKKTEVISEAFDVAERSAAAAGTGGNVVNRYKQVINNILNDKNKMRYFDDSEIFAMRDFIKFTPTEQAARLIGRLDPSANGLMTALNLAAVATNPSMAVFSAAGAISRRAAEGITNERGDALMQRIATGQTPTFNRVAVPQAMSPVVVSEYQRQEEQIRGNR